MIPCSSTSGGSINGHRGRYRRFFPYIRQCNVPSPSLRSPRWSAMIRKRQLPAIPVTTVSAVDTVAGLDDAHPDRGLWWACRGAFPVPFGNDLQFTRVHRSRWTSLPHTPRPVVVVPHDPIGPSGLRVVIPRARAASTTKFSVDAQSTKSRESACLSSRVLPSYGYALFWNVDPLSEAFGRVCLAV